MNAIKNAIRTIFTFRWKPGLDLVIVLISCILVTTSLYVATMIVTPETGGGMPYFFTYAGLTAIVFGIGLPLAWMVLYRKRPIQDLGITTRYLGISIVLQLVFTVFQYLATLAKADLPALEKVAPLLALALTIGFFEALFWRGWVLLRLEEAFGLIPAIILGSALYAGIRLVPVYLEYTKVARALEQVRDEHAAIDTNPQLIRNSLERRWDVEDIKSIGWKEIEIKKSNDGYDVKAVYNVEQPFIANVFLLVKFDKSVVIQQ